MIKNYNITKYQYNYLKDFLQLAPKQIKNILYAVYEMAYNGNDNELKNLDTETLEKYKIWAVYRASKSKTNTLNGLKNKGMMHNENSKKKKTTKLLKQVNEMLDLFYKTYSEYVETQKHHNGQKYKKSQIMYILKDTDKIYIKNLFTDRVKENKPTHTNYIKKCIDLLPTIPKLKKSFIDTHLKENPYKYMTTLNNLTYSQIFKKQNSKYTLEKLY